MLCLMLLISEMGILVAQLSSTLQTATVFKNLTALQNNNETLCGGECNNIKCLLNNQKLSEIPACIPHNVKALYLNYNHFTVIWDWKLTNFSQLQSLFLAHNQIQEVLCRSQLLPQLEVLDLSHNHLVIVPVCLTMKKMKKLSLAGNPISQIGPYAFKYFPNMEFLNLSSTLIGSRSYGDIEASAFALNAMLTQESSLNSLQLLDLSNTYLTQVDEAWSKHLPNLRVLYLKEMINLMVLDDKLIQWFPHLEVLDCTESGALSWVPTEIFGNASELKHLSFRKCNLTNFPPWTLASPRITVDVSGNPFICNCELLWLFADPVQLTLIRENETSCSQLKGDALSFSLLEWSNFCQKKAYQDQTMSTAAVTNSNSVTKKQESSVTATPTPQDIGKQLYIPETVTVFKTTEADTTNVSPKQETSSFVQEAFTLVTENGLTNNTSVNSSVGTLTSIMYITESILVTSEEVTSIASNIKGGSGQLMTEDILNKEQGNIHQDYYDDEKSQPDRSTIPSTMPACDYDGCRHLQIPCTELQLRGPCLCPGLLGDDLIPHPPYLKNMSEITDTSAQIHWCSPNSVTDKYQLVYQPVGGQMKTVDNIYVTMRQYTLYNLTPFTTYKVCVVAINTAGQSEAENSASGTPCTEFQTKPSYIMILSLVGGLCGLFLIIIVGLAILLYRAYKNTIVNQYNTHLVSYKNPAFEYHLTIPSYH